MVAFSESQEQKEYQSIYLSGDIRVHGVCTELRRVEKETSSGGDDSLIVILGRGHLALMQIYMSSTALAGDCFE